MNNLEIANLLFQLADFLEATKNRFRARAYCKAANVITDLQTEITILQENNVDLQKLPYIGKGIPVANHF